MESSDAVPPGQLIKLHSSMEEDRGTKVASPLPKRNSPGLGHPPRPAEGVSKALWFVAGTLLLSIGLVGVALPILPTTPFLLLAAACYLRSSKRMYDWMMTNRVFGKYLRAYHEGTGIPARVKVGAIAFLWAAIVTSAVFFTDEVWLRAVLVVIAVAVSIHIATIRPRSQKGQDAPV